MAKFSKSLLIFLVTLLLLDIIQSSPISVTEENGVKTAVFLSPKFKLRPGLVAYKNFYGVEFPRGHIAIKSFDAEAVDEAGNSVPLYETYLHHWVAVNYYQRIGVKMPKNSSNVGFQNSDRIVAGNDGVCAALSQVFGLGSETRKTSTYVPDPYGIEFGNPVKIPAGYEEKWLLSVLAIDTRGAEDRLGCIECRCDLYNVTVDASGQKVDPSYGGGLRCCYDKTTCRVREGFRGVKRSLFLKYTVKYVDWHSSIVPVRIYVFDVTDKWKRSDGIVSKHDCQVEYNVESCRAGVAYGGCIDNRNVSIILPSGGDVIYGVAHQHVGTVGSTVYGEDGRVICSSLPMYGKGRKPGNEAGYVVGMSTCYPKPGSVKISDGETLTVSSYYSSKRRHTGVMGLFYIYVADSQWSVNRSNHAPLGSTNIWGMATFGVAVVVLFIVTHHTINQKGYNYETIMPCEHVSLSFDVCCISVPLFEIFLVSSLSFVLML